MIIIHEKAKLKQLPEKGQVNIVIIPKTGRYVYYLLLPQFLDKKEGNYAVCPETVLACAVILPAPTRTKNSTGATVLCHLKVLAHPRSSQ